MLLTSLFLSLSLSNFYNRLPIALQSLLFIFYIAFLSFEKFVSTILQVDLYPQLAQQLRVSISSPPMCISNHLRLKYYQLYMEWLGVGLLELSKAQI